MPMATRLHKLRPFKMSSASKAKPIVPVQIVLPMGTSRTRIETPTARQTKPLKKYRRVARHTQDR